MSLSLAEVPTPALERLRELLLQGRLTFPLTAFALRDLGLAALADQAPHLRSLNAEILALLLDAVLDERRKRPLVELAFVWTGPEAKASTARDTAVVLAELFSSARQFVLIAGYSFDHGGTLLQPLHAVMREHSVSCSIFIDRPAAETFRAKQWPFGPPFPELFVDARDDAPYSSVHAKCVVVDAARALVTSANFTDRGQTRNIEVGLLIHDARFATQLQQQWLALTGEGYFQSV